MSEQEQPTNDALNTFVQGMVAWVNQFSANVQTLIGQVMPVLQRISDAMWESYRNAGMPYGDSHEGLMQWIEDMGEIMRHQQEIERIQMRHEMKAHARMLGEQMRAKREEDAR